MPGSPDLVLVNTRYHMSIECMADLADTRYLEIRATSGYGTSRHKSASLGDLGEKQQVVGPKYLSIWDLGENGQV